MLQANPAVCCANLLQSYSCALTLALVSILVLFLPKKTNPANQVLLIMFQEILEVEQLVGEQDTGLELTSENVEKSLDEIR